MVMTQQGRRFSAMILESGTEDEPVHGHGPLRSLLFLQATPESLKIIRHSSRLTCREKKEKSMASMWIIRYTITIWETLSDPIIACCKTTRHRATHETVQVQTY